MSHQTKNRALTVGAALLSALAVWSFLRLAGAPLDLKDAAASDNVRAFDVILATLVAGFAAWAVYAWLSNHDRTRYWPATGSTALAISIVGPTWLADGWSAIWLIALHFVVAVVLIYGFARYGTEESPPEGHRAGTPVTC